MIASPPVAHPPINSNRGRIDIAFVIPCFNGARYLRETLEAVAHTEGLSRYRAALVLSDDASTDGSVEVFRAWLSAYDGPLEVRFVSRETNGGTAAALNSAIEAVPEAEWIWPIAADDLLIADALSEWERVRALGADAMPAAYQAFGHDSNGAPIDESSSKSRRIYAVENITEGFRRGQHLSSGCSPFRRRFWEMVGFDEDLRTAEDTLFWLRIHRRGARFIPSRRPVVRVRYHALRKSFTPIARDRKTKIRMIKERKDQPTCDFLASERHFAEHLAPVWRALAPWARGRFMVPVGLRDYASNVLGVRAVPYRDRGLFDLLKADSPLTATAAAGDQQQCAVAGRWTVYSEHGSGQCYNRKHSSYANYAHRRSVALFLAPGARPAAQFRSLYPSIPTVEVGALMLDDWQSGARRVPGDGVVALSFHWNARVVPETSSAWQHYERVLPELKARFGSKIIGHSHPRIADKMRQVYAKAGIEYVETFDEVLHRASVYCVDNSSTLFSFAAAAPKGESRPVVVLNCPAYRKGVQHGMRFWEFADIGPQVDQPNQLLEAIEQIIVGDLGDLDRARREAILDLVYTERSGGSAALAARAIEEALGRPLPSQVGHPKNRRRFVQQAHGRPSQVVRFSPKLNNQNGAMAEPRTVRMIADVTFANRQHEGQVRRRSAFFTTERRAVALERQGHAHRAPVVSAPIARGPKITKPAGPSKTKPSVAPLAKGYFTTTTLKTELKRLSVFFKSGESKSTLYDRYVESFAQEA